MLIKLPGCVNGQLESEEMLWPPSMIMPKQLLPETLEARIEL